MQLLLKSNLIVEDTKINFLDMAHDKLNKCGLKLRISNDKSRFHILNYPLSHTLIGWIKEDGVKINVHIMLIHQPIINYLMIASLLPGIVWFLMCSPEVLGDLSEILTLSVAIVGFIGINLWMIYDANKSFALMVRKLFDN